MKIDILYLCIFLFSVFISSISQIILKKSADKQHAGVLKEYLNFHVIIAYGLFFCSSFIAMLSYKKIPLSLGAALEATGYIWVTILGLLLLKEKVSKRKWIGLSLIICGIIVFNWTP